MIAGIYARKSTEQKGIGDEEKSVTRQVQHAKAFAKKKGWSLAEEHVYVDDGISGAEFVKRPGLARLMLSLKPKPAFTVLVMSEESRLGREQIETAYILKQIIDAGVRVFFYLSDQERTLDSALDKVMLSLTSFASEVEREKASQRTHDAMLRKAKALHVASGRLFGYDNVEVLSPAPGADGRQKRLHVVRRINPQQAAVVRRIFEMCASGKGLTRIAKTLNADHVPPPRGDGKGWAPTAIREMLYRPLYRGEVVWNQTQKITRGGTKKQRARPESDWVRVSAPDLGIVSQDLWDRVHARLEQTRQAFLRRSGNGQLLGRPTRLDLESPYLLSGMGTCSECGGALIATTRAHGKSRARFYGCGYNHKRGKHVCRNGFQIQQEILDQAILDAICAALDQRAIEFAVEQALRRLRDGEVGQLDRRASIGRELSLIEARMRHLAEAIAQGEPLDALLTQLREEEARKKSLVYDLDGLVRRDRVASLDQTRLKRQLVAKATDLRGLLTRRVPQARQVIRKLVVGRLAFTPFEEGVGRVTGSWEKARTGVS